MNCPVCGQYFEARCPSCGWRGYLRRLLPIFILVTAIGMNWQINFNVDGDNVGVVVTTECKIRTTTDKDGKTIVVSPPFYAYDRVDLADASQSTITMRRQPTPKGARCTVMASIMRAYDNDPSHEYAGESVIVIQED